MRPGVPAVGSAGAERRGFRADPWPAVVDPESAALRAGEEGRRGHTSPTGSGRAACIFHAIRWKMHAARSGDAVRGHERRGRLTEGRRGDVPVRLPPRSPRRPGLRSHLATTVVANCELTGGGPGRRTGPARTTHASPRPRPVSVPEYRPLCV